MGTTVRIALASGDGLVAELLKIRLESKGYQVVTLNDLEGALGLVYVDPPDIVIADLSSPEFDSSRLIRTLKGDSYFSAIPVLGLFAEGMAERFIWEDVPLDDFITLPPNYAEFFSRITLSLQRVQRVFDNNPLTRLPGNTSIQHAIEAVLGKPMAVCYLDINNFKPYNDVYGFSHGDEVLRMVARITFNAVKESGGGFTGHIGGDDFVFIVPVERSERVCQTIIDHFTAIVADIFDPVAKEQGHYTCLNRQGHEERVPLPGVSIAVVPTDNPMIQHYGKLAEVAAELKKLAKKSGKSCFVIDRRRQQPMRNDS